MCEGRYVVESLSRLSPSTTMTTNDKKSEKNICKKYGAHLVLNLVSFTSQSSMMSANIFEKSNSISLSFKSVKGTQSVCEKAGDRQEGYLFSVDGQAISFTFHWTILFCVRHISFLRGHKYPNTRSVIIRHSYTFNPHDFFCPLPPTQSNTS